jgi:large subunit ribosomal protein L5
MAAPRLKERYEKDVIPTLRKEFEYDNVMQVPKLHKVVVNIGVGEARQNAKALDAAAADLTTIAGQKPVITKAKKSINQFKIRQGDSIGVMVTLRGNRMYEFLDRVMNAALPRVRDFQGVSRIAFDGRGNYSLGVREQLIFPEVEYDKIDKLRGMEISIVTSARTDEEGRRLLQLLGMPFRSA